MSSPNTFRPFTDEEINIVSAALVGAETKASQILTQLKAGYTKHLNRTIQLTHESIIENMRASQGIKQLFPSNPVKD